MGLIMPSPRQPAACRPGTESGLILSVFGPPPHRDHRDTDGPSRSQLHRRKPQKDTLLFRQEGITAKREKGR